MEDELIENYNLVELSPGVIVMDVPNFKDLLRVLNLEAFSNCPNNASVRILSSDREEREHDWKTFAGWG